ncbi:hypothetical protein ACOSQ2_017243 [Xanthoceras sorbifolium]
MATPTTHFLGLNLKLFTAAIIGILILGGSGQITAARQPDENECRNGEGLGVLFGCLKFIKKEGPKVEPSSDCCKGVKEIGMTCTCSIITKEIEDIISMEKLLFVAHSCGNSLQPGTTCGSYMVPPA